MTTIDLNRKPKNGKCQYCFDYDITGYVVVPDGKLRMWLCDDCKKYHTTYNRLEWNPLVKKGGKKKQ
jgi:hypothetical protein